MIEGNNSTKNREKSAAIFLFFSDRLDGTEYPPIPPPGIGGGAADVVSNLRI